MIFLLVISGCGQNTTCIVPGDLKPTEIPVVIPPVLSPAELTISSNLPGMLRAIGYSGPDMVSGTAQFSRPEYVPQTEIRDSRIRIFQKVAAQPLELATSSFLNLWKLKIRDAQSFSLIIQNERAEGHWNLSGLPITSLDVKAGSGKNSFTTDEPNPNVMQNFVLECSTGETIIEGIMYAHWQNAQIIAGNGSLTLRFNGKGIGLHQNINIQGSDGDIILKIPQELPARVSVSRIGELDVDNEFEDESSGQDSVFVTRSYQPGQLVEIDINITGCTGRISVVSLY